MLEAPSVRPLRNAFMASTAARISAGVWQKQGHQPGHRLAVLGDGEFFSLSRPLQELGQMGFRLERSDGFHEQISFTQIKLVETSLNEIAYLAKRSFVSVRPDPRSGYERTITLLLREGEKGRH